MSDLIAVDREALNELKDSVSQLMQMKEPFNKATEKPVPYEEFCKTMKISLRTFKNWRADGTIPTHKIGGKIFIYWSEINEAARNAD